MQNPFRSTTQPTAPIALNNAQFLAVRALRINGQLARTQIAELIDYSPSKLTKVANDLIADDIILEKSMGEYTGGRRTKELFFNPSFGYFVAIAIGVNQLEIAIVDFSETIRSRQKIPLENTVQPIDILQQISDSVSKRMQRLNIPIEKVYGIGITLPSAVNGVEGTLYDTPVLPGWGGYQIESFVRELFPYAVVMIERDSHAMAFAELRRGQGKLHDDFIYINVGKTVSAGIIINGKIYRGANGRAGDIDNLKIMSDNAMTELGGLAIKWHDGDFDQNYLEDLSISAQEGDKVAQAFIENIALQIGQALSTLVTVLDPEIILIGGLAQQWGHPFLASIRRNILTFSQSSSTQHLQVDIAPLGNEATITGIIALVAEHIFVVEGKS